jgi:hypothetical protein
MDDPYPERMSVGGGPERLRGASSGQRSLVGSIDAFKDAHERRLPGAVLAHQREDVAGAHGQRHVMERSNHPEGLRDADRREDGAGLPRAVLHSIAELAGRLVAPPRGGYL